jgi:PAS domain S-box-containing protein
MGGTNIADVTVLSFPADDVVFAERVREALDSVPRDSGGQDLERLLAIRLRRVHPHVATSQRHSLAGFGGTTIYVYRDGSPLSSLDDEAWIRDPDTARVVTDDTGRYVEANEAAALLFRVPANEIVGREAGTFTHPDARIEHAAELWRAIASRRRVHSLAVVRCPEGTEESVEFITVRDEAGTGRHVTYLRPVA